MFPAGLRTRPDDRRSPPDRAGHRPDDAAGRRSEPAAVAGESGRLDAGAGAGLADRRGQVVAHRALATGAAGRRCSATVAPVEGQRAAPRPRARSAGSRPRRSDSVASAGSTTRRPACTRRTASASCAAGVSLTTKPGGAGLERPAQVARTPEGRDDQHAAPTTSRPRPPARLDAVQPGHLDVEQAHVGARARRPRQRPRRRGRPRPRPRGPARGRAAPPALPAPAPGRRPAAAGSACSPRHLQLGAAPGGGRRPAAGRPIRRPARAGPAGRCRSAGRRAPRPSSRPTRRRLRRASTVQRCAPEWRTTLVTASRSTHAATARRRGSSAVAVRGQVGRDAGGAQRDRRRGELVVEARRTQPAHGRADLGERLTGQGLDLDAARRGPARDRGRPAARPARP